MTEQGSRPKKTQQEANSQFSAWIENAQQLVMFFDFDGTLSPYVPDPAKAAMSVETHDNLQEIGSKAVYAAIISGRNGTDLAKRADISGFEYFGNYGMEYIAHNQLAIYKGAETYVAQIAKTKEETLRMLKPYGDEVLYEDKGVLALSIHIRAHEIAQTQEIKEDIKMKLEQIVKQIGDLSLRVHPTSLEVRPPLSIDKATVVQDLMMRLVLAIPEEFRLLYIGDDEHDAQAMQSVRKMAELKHGRLLCIGVLHGKKDTLLEQVTDIQFQEVSEVDIFVKQMKKTLEARPTATKVAITFPQYQIVTS